jgi:hypothetical protein
MRATYPILLHVRNTRANCKQRFQEIAKSPRQPRTLGAARAPGPMSVVSQENIYYDQGDDRGRHEPDTNETPLERSARSVAEGPEINDECGAGDDPGGG